MRTTDSDPPTPPSMSALLEQLDAVVLGDDTSSRRTSNARSDHPQSGGLGVRCGMSSESEYEVVYRPAAAPLGSAGEGSTSRREDATRPNSSRSRRGKKQDAKGIDVVSTSESDNNARPRQLGAGVAAVAGIDGISAADAGGLAVAGADAAKKKKTRRSGRKARRRLDNGQMRETAAVEDELGLEPGPESESESGLETSPSSSSNDPSSWRGRSSPSEDGDGDEYSEDGASRFLDGSGSGEDEEDEEEVDALSDLGSVSSERSDVTTTSESTMSREEARSAIDSFLSQTASFTSDKANKLLLWQALCLEFGLVQPSEGLPDLPDLPSVRPSRSPHRDPLSDISRSRSATPTPSCPGTPAAPSSLPGLPQSLNQAMRILKTQAHVNLADYFDARSGGAVHIHGPGSIPTAPAAAGQPGIPPNDYSSLVFPSTAAMQRYTRKEKRFVDLGTVKAEWLQPLLKDFGFKRSRGATRH